MDNTESIRDLVKMAIKEELSKHVHVRAGVADSIADGVADQVFQVTNVTSLEQQMTARNFKERFYEPERLADLMIKFVNIIGHESESHLLMDRWIRQHRTLKQSLTRLFALWFLRLEFDDWDARNEASVMLARKVAKEIREHPLPFI
jgi:hypothetical protein